MGENKKRWTVLGELLKDKKPKIGAEIGVLAGNLTVKILKRFPSIKIYYAIDPWTFYPTYKETLSKRGQKFWNQDMLDENFKTFKQNIENFGDRVRILKMFSNEAVDFIKDNSLDFLFIDGNHSYEYVKEDIELYLPKIKIGGLIGGHDYGYKVGGVKMAVDEIFSDSVFFGSDKTWWVWL